MGGKMIPTGVDKPNYPKPLLPPEVLLLIFEAVSDTPTVLSIRLVSKFYSRRIVNRQDLYHTLRLNKSRRHAAVKYKRMLDLGIDKYVEKVEICTSCYFGGLLPEGDRPDYDTDVYEGEEPEPHAYGKLRDDFERISLFPPDEAPRMRKLIYFLTYVLRTLCNEPPAPPRRLRLDLIQDQSDEEILDHMALRYPQDPRWNDKATIKGKEWKYLISSITQMVGLALSRVTHRIFVTDRKIFEPGLDLYEIRYRLSGIELEIDGPGRLLISQYWWLSCDYRRGMGREYRLEVKEIKYDGGIDVDVGEVICRRHPGEDFRYQDFVFAEKSEKYAYILDYTHNDENYDDRIFIRDDSE